MGELANSVAEVFAAVLRAVGFVGTPRKRAAIRDDLALLRELDEFPGGEFGPGNAPHIWLTAHIYQQVGEFSGLDFRTERRKIAWGGVVFASTLWVGFGWLTYHLVAVDHGWWAAFPAAFAWVFFLSTLGLLSEKEQVLQGLDEEAESLAEADELESKIAVVSFDRSQSGT